MALVLSLERHPLILVFVFYWYKHTVLFFRLPEISIEWCMCVGSVPTNSWHCLQNEPVKVISGWTICDASCKKGPYVIYLQERSYQELHYPPISQVHVALSFSGQCSFWLNWVNTPADFELHCSSMVQGSCLYDVIHTYVWHGPFWHLYQVA